MMIAVVVADMTMIAVVVADMAMIAVVVTDMAIGTANVIAITTDEVAATGDMMTAVEEVDMAMTVAVAADMTIAETTMTVTGADIRLGDGFLYSSAAPFVQLWKSGDDVVSI